MMDVLVTNARLHAAASHLRDFAGSDCATALVKLINALMEAYKDELTYVKPDGLLALQAQVAQLEALKAVMGGAVQTNGRI